MPSRHFENNVLIYVQHVRELLFLQVRSVFSLSGVKSGMAISNVLNVAFYTAHFRLTALDSPLVL
jgi:hypothetical protein